MLLDRLAPGWKTQILTDDLFLEDLLTEAAPGGPEFQLPDGGSARFSTGDYAALIEPMLRV
jgi:hypothetical protein